MTTYRIVATTALLALLVGTFGPLVAQDWKGRGRMQGIVTDENGDPVAGAKVTLRYTGGSEGGPEPLTTNQKGRWSYLGLTGGGWKVEIEAPGYAISEGVMRVSEFGANDVLKTPLKPAAAVAAASAGAGDSAAAAEQAAAAEATRKLSEAGKLIEQGELAEGRALMESALSDLDASKQTTVLLALAKTYFSEGDIDQTVATIDRVLAVDPNYVEGLRLAASVLVNEGRQEEAQAYIDRLPEGAGIDPMAMLNQGIKKYNENDLDGALEAFDDTVNANPNLADAYYYRGLTHLGKGNNEAAIADFEKLLVLDPNHANAGEARQFLDYLKSQ